MTNRLRERAVFSGFLVGAVGGALLALLRAPRLKPAAHLKQVQQDVRQKLEAVIPEDPISQSLAEGKAAARRRLNELGTPSFLPAAPTQPEATAAHRPR
ncbi:MAG: hypothetical protein H7Y11_13865 [Armatimonadetes bacterium]|nr:hypothetical protein [Anaerolineae bacterium]